MMAQTLRTLFPHDEREIHRNKDSVASELMQLHADGKHLRPTITPLPLPFAKGSKQSLLLCGTVDGVLSEGECSRLVALTERRGYVSALINIGGGRQALDTQYRNSGRCIIDSADAAALLWERVRGCIPEEHCTKLAQRAAWRAVGLNERLRFLRYGPGEYFAPHQDGSYVRDAGPRRGERSFLTLMIYLNEPAEGGETKFLNPAQYAESEQLASRQQNKGRRGGTGRGKGEVAYSECRPRRGLALLFDHELLHEGAPVLDGIKYVLRTDVMFARIEPASHVAADAAGAGLCRSTALSDLTVAE